MRFEKKVTHHGVSCILAWGYDGPMDEYFAQLWAPEGEPDGEDKFFFWIGEKSTIVPLEEGYMGNYTADQIEKILQGFGIGYLPDEEYGYENDLDEEFKAYEVRV